MTKALYRKWRPQTWDEVASQDHIIQTLRNAVANDRVAHAYLFAGPRGTGKTSTARLLAKAVNCLDPDLANRPCNHCDYCLALNAGRFMDLIEIDAASNTSVDDVRDLRDKINFSPSQGRFKVYIIDEVHMLSTAAFNALLKTLEEPPPHAIFVLATTEIHKIPATVLSRCQQHEFRRIPLHTIIDHLKEKSQEEGIKVESPALNLIARQATGSLRDAISLLDQLAATEETISLEMAQKVLGTATNLSVIEIVDALIAKDTSGGLTLIHKNLDSGTDPRQLARQLVAYLRNVLLYKMGNQDQLEEADNIREKIFVHASKFEMPDLLQSIEVFNKATSGETGSWHPGLALELAFTSFLVRPQIALMQSSPVDHPVEKSVPTLQSKTPKKRTVEVTQDRPKPVTKQVQEPEKATALEEGTEPEKPETVKTEAPPIDLEKTPDQIAGTDDKVPLDQIHESWNTIKSKVGKHNRRTEALLNTAKLIGIKDNQIILSFSSELLKDMMEKEGNIILTTDILEEVFGKPLYVKCIVTTNPSDKMVENIKFEEDGMVSTATRDLGGRISKAEQIDP